MLEILLSFSVATVTLAISPGPDNVFVLTQSIVNGKKYGLATVFGLMTGSYTVLYFRRYIYCCFIFYIFFDCYFSGITFGSD
ncbi:hypothetical protein AUW17_06325 [Tenacibaculum dicentrarchi]|nr:hypothetical protein AUW17_06325 [Tenacibaculum dicentrarchi]